MAVVTTASFLAVVICTIIYRSSASDQGVCNSNESTLKLITFFDFVGGVVKDANELVEKNNAEDRPIDCTDLRKRGARSGIHKIWPRSRVVEDPIDVVCDMDDDNGGWTVIQRRGDFNSSEDYFYRDWNSYKKGFGDLNKGFWIGNDIIFALTNQRACSIKFDLIDWGGVKKYAIYDSFWIDDELHNYTLHVKGYRGTAGDSFTYHDGNAFETKDKHTSESPTNCASDYNGAWWYKKCLLSHLNGLYLKEGAGNSVDGVRWKTFKEEPLKETFMKIRQMNME